MTSVLKTLRASHDRPRYGRSVYYQLGRQARFVMVRRKAAASIEAEIASFVAGTRDLIAPWLAGFGFSQGEVGRIAPN